VDVFVLYLDTPPRINQVAQLFHPVYDTVHTTIREVKAALERGIHVVWTHLQEDADNPTQIDDASLQCSIIRYRCRPTKVFTTAVTIFLIDNAGKMRQAIK
jgi:hypothetical protein